MKKIRIIAAILLTALLMGCNRNIKDGVAFLEEGKYEEAITCFEKDVAEEKHLQEAYRGMGIAYFELEDYAKASTFFENAVDILLDEEETASLHSMMAVCYLKQNEFEKALDSYWKALEFECTEEMKQEILFNEIAIYQELKDWKALKDKVAAYVEQYPDDTRMEKTAEFLETR